MKKIAALILALMIIALAAWALVGSDHNDTNDPLPDGVILEESLDIETRDPQPAGRNLP